MVGALQRFSGWRVFGLAILFLCTATPAQGAPAPWEDVSKLEDTLAEAEKALIIDGQDVAAKEAARATPLALALAAGVRDEAPAEASRIVRGTQSATEEVATGGAAGLAAARAEVRTAILGAAYRSALAALERGDTETAQAWLLVREFRKPTRFSRPGADATLAITGLEKGTLTPAQALEAVRADLLDTYQGLLATALDDGRAAVEQGFFARAAGLSALARGYFQILESSYESQTSSADAGKLLDSFDRLAEGSLAGDAAGFDTEVATIENALRTFRATPLSAEEEQRRAGQFQRFLALAPVEYGRGVEDGRVTLDFEVQEAITFRDGAAQAFGDLEPALSKLDAASAARIGELVDELGTDLQQAAHGQSVADPEAVKATTDEALKLAESVFPAGWKSAGAQADFDVIRATLDRVEGAVAAHEYGRAEAARLEAYAFFEFGPEQRLRGIAPSLFVRVEGLFWYGTDGYSGLAQLVEQRAATEEVAATRQALDAALADAEAAVGSGPQSTFAVVTNTAIIVFREGLEAVLILAALTAGLVGARRRLRRPLFFGAAAALLATIATFAIAQTVLGSLTRYGEKLEAVVSLVAIAVLLVILNWFYHRVYWGEHLAELHGRKKQLLRGAGLSLATAQLAGLAMLGFSSVYREGFETTLFLQAIALEAGAGALLEGVLLGFAGVAAIAVLTIILQRKLPHRRMLELTGLLILGVLAIMVGKTVQVCQVVGWLPVTPIDGVSLPYWAGSWFGVFPTWQGVGAQAFAVTLVLGSYVLSEQLRARHRRRIVAPTPKPPERPFEALPHVEAQLVESRESVPAASAASLSE